MQAVLTLTLLFIYTRISISLLLISQGYALGYIDYAYKL